MKAIQRKKFLMYVNEVPFFSLLLKRVYRGVNVTGNMIINFRVQELFLSCIYNCKEPAAFRGIGFPNN